LNQRLRLVERLGLTTSTDLATATTTNSEMATGLRLPQRTVAAPATYRYEEVLASIIEAYDSPIVRWYSRVRFIIININIIHMLALCMRGKRRILDIGCGFGLFGCYFSKIFPGIEYHGIDLNAQRVDMARTAASRLGLDNTKFSCRDARDLTIDDQYDAIMMIDLMHHIDDSAKKHLIQTCSDHIAPGGRLIIKDVTTRPLSGMAFTWALDVFMTRGFDMWYRDEDYFHNILGEYFSRVDVFAITDWLPYPHIIYLSEKAEADAQEPLEIGTSLRA
jgi:2-polyprenyl-3-methyl-5-hydroxy-6-metoxy-1,4-benzoquinol methylase